MSSRDQEAVHAVTDALTGGHRKWITEFAYRIDMTFEDLMAELDDAVMQGGNSIQVGDNQIDFPDELWEHYQQYRLKEVSQTVKDNTWFSCSC